MIKWLILLSVVLFSSSVLAENPKLRGPSHSLNSRPRISSMNDRGKPHVRVHEDRRNRRNWRNYSRELIRYEDYYYRPPQPIIVIVHVLTQPAPQPKSSPKIVRTSSHVTIFAKSTPNSRRFGAGTRGGPIIFPKKSEAKTKP